MPNLSSNGKLTKAFTLIEILIAISIMGLVFGVGYASFRGFSRRQSLISFARKIKGDLSLARQKAMAGEKPESLSCNSPNTLSGYNFRLVSNTNYVLEAVCSGGIVAVEGKDIDAPGGVSMSYPSPNPIVFKVLGSGTNIVSSDAQITLTQTGTGNTISVYVTKGGEIK